ncbi:MAG: hypothetical protein J6A04_05685, partial [Clostridia bacterium]|nr:hypothetical protein [Clostridia bacterium]
LTVEAGAVIIVEGYPGYSTYTINGVAKTDTATVLIENDGLVEIISTGSSYLYGIYLKYDMDTTGIEKI